MARVAGLAVFLVVVAGVGQGQGVVGVRGLGAVALAQLAGLWVRRQGIGVTGQIGSALAAAEQVAAKEAALGVARRVVVGRRGSEALLFLAVTTEAEFGQGRDDEEDTGKRKTRRC